MEYWLTPEGLSGSALKESGPWDQWGLKRSPNTLRAESLDAERVIALKRGILESQPSHCAFSFPQRQTLLLVTVSVVIIKKGLVLVLDS